MPPCFYRAALPDFSRLSQAVEIATTEHRIVAYFGSQRRAASLLSEQSIPVFGFKRPENEGVCQLLERGVTDALLQDAYVLLNGLKQLQGADLQANSCECGTGEERFAFDLLMDFFTVFLQ